MKKILSVFLLGIVLFLSSCVDTSQQTRTIEADLPIENLFSNFMSKHPNFDTNDITRKEVYDAFVVMVKDTIEKCHLFEGVPVKLATINKCKNGKYVAHFQSWITPTNFDYRYKITKICFDVVGVVPDSLALTLSDKSYYTFSGDYISNINFEVMERLLERGTTGITFDFGMEKDVLSRDEFSLHFAYMLYDFKEIKPFAGRAKEEVSYEEWRRRTYSVR